MAFSYFSETCIAGKKYTLNSYRYKKIKDNYLLIADQGSWVVLKESEFKNLLKHKISDSLFKLLEEKGIIITNNNLSIILDNYKKRHEFLFRGTTLHIIVSSLRCNHKCVYCHSSAKKSTDTSYDMSKKTAKKTLNFIFQTPSNNFTIEFQGGDALINFDSFKYLVLEAKNMNKYFKKNIRFSLVTNLTLMKPEYIEFINKENINICTSLDGPEEIHNQNRIYEGGKGTYEDVVFWMNKIQNEYNQNIAALMVTTKHSLKLWKEIIDEYVKQGKTMIQIKYLNKLGFESNRWQLEGYSADEFIEFWEKSVDYIIELNKKGIFIRERYVQLILSKILTKHDPDFLDWRSPCGIVAGQMAYDYNGDIFSCDEGRNFDIFKMGNVHKNNYKDVVTSKKSLELISSSINDSLLCDNCVYKPYCGVCPVLSFAENNNIIPKINKFSKCKISKAQFDYVFEKLIFRPDIREIFFKWIKNE